MSRKTTFIAVILLSAITSVLSAQNAHPAPAVPQVIGPRLVVWSNVQKPEPLNQEPGSSPPAQVRTQSHSEKDSSRRDDASSQQPASPETSGSQSSPAPR